MKKQVSFSFYVLFLLIISTSFSPCQIQSKIDSLENLLFQNELNDEERMTLFLGLAQEYGFTSPERSIEYGKLALGLSRESGDIIHELIALRYLGVGYHYMDEYNTALAYYDSSLVLAVKAEHKDGEGACLHN